MLAIDIGNTRIKWALYKNGQILVRNAVGYDRVTLEVVLNGEKLPVASNRVLISNVAGDQIKLQVTRFLEAHKCDDYSFVKTQSLQCSVSNSYDVVENMGVDRWLAMIAAYHSPLRGSQEAVCVVDCGTAITLDVVGSDGKHLGGLIMPGFQTMYKSLMKQTGDISSEL